MKQDKMQMTKAPVDYALPEVDALIVEDEGVPWREALL